MKVVFIDQDLNCGGAERVSCIVMRMLIKNNFDVHLVLTGRRGALAHFIPPQVQVHELGFSHTRNSLISVIQSIRCIRPDIVFSTHDRTTVLALLARPFCHSYKVVARYSTMPGLLLKGQERFCWRYWLIKSLYKRVDAIIAQTEEMAGELYTFFKIPLNRIHTIANPVDADYIAECLNGVTDPYENFTGGKNIVAIGTLYPAKAYDVLIRAFELLREDFPDSRLFILGTDRNGYKKYLEEIVERSSVAMHVYFEGFRENPYPYLKYADLFVLSSRREGLPNVLLEARYLGCRIAATDCVPVISRIMAGQYLAPVDDAQGLAREMSRALSNEPLPPMNSQTGEEYAHLFESVVN